MDSCVICGIQHPLWSVVSRHKESTSSTSSCLSLQRQKLAQDMSVMIEALFWTLKQCVSTGLTGHKKTFMFFQDSQIHLVLQLKALGQGSSLDGYCLHQPGWFCFLLALHKHQNTQVVRPNAFGNKPLFALALFSDWWLFLATLAASHFSRRISRCHLKISGTSSAQRLQCLSCAKANLFEVNSRLK